MFRVTLAKTKRI